MSSRIKENVKKLFEYWCEVIKTDDCNQSGVITESFPENFQDEQIIAKIPDFAYPCEFERDSLQSYSFVLTSDDSKWRFGFCRHDPKTDSAMIVITYLPWHDTFLKLLTVLAELRRANNGDFVTFLSEAYNRGVPDPGGSLKLLYNNGQNHFIFERPLQFQLPSIPENHNLNLYYNFVDPKNMISVFAAMLAERRIIFTSRRLDRLSSCIQAANAFLYPMVWQHIFIPILPLKLKDILSAPMPYLIGVPEPVLETMTAEELGDVVILNCDTKIFESPFDDLKEMPPEIISQLKKHLSHSNEHIGDRVSKIFLCVLVQLIGGYRDAIEFGAERRFNRQKFIDSRPNHLRPFLAKMTDLQIFQQFIDERLEMLNTGLGFSDEFELETVRYAEKMKKRGRNYAFLKNVKDKTNPAVKSAVKSVKEGSKGVKTAYKDLKSRFRDITPPKTNFHSHISNSQHDGIGGGYNSRHPGPHSAPSSPIFNKRTGFAYTTPMATNVATTALRKPLAMSNSHSQIQQQNGYSNITSNSVVTNNILLGVSPTISPTGSICLSEMNLSQELQNHPLFKSPNVDRTLKPSSSLDLNHRNSIAVRSGPPARPPPPILNSHHPLSPSKSALSSSYTNHPHASQTLPMLHHHHHHYHHHYQHHNNHPYQHQHQRNDEMTAIMGNDATNITINNMATPERNTQMHGDDANNSNQIKIVTTDSVFDNPPDMLSPPVPPRRNTTNNNKNDGRTKFQPSKPDRKWIGFPDSIDSMTPERMSQKNLNGRTSYLLHQSSVSSSSPLYGNDPPVPAPRHKKESLRSLQQHYLQVPSVSQPLPSQNSAVSPFSAHSTTTTTSEPSNDLISLDDSSNTSFDLEDFDPLNLNAKPIPTTAAAMTSKSTTLPQTSSSNIITSNSVSNPLYPYFAPQQHRNTLPPSKGGLQLPAVSNECATKMKDDDFELLRKYGLDQFTLTVLPTASSLSSAQQAIQTTGTVQQGKSFNDKSSSSHATISTGINNWTTFD